MTKQKFFNRPIWAIMSIGFGMMLVVSGTEWYHYIMAAIGFLSGGHNLYKNYKNKSRHICEFCGYVALDQRDFHNHQITCEKKK